MTFSLNHAGVQGIGCPTPGASRSIRPEIPGRPSTTPPVKPTTTAPANPVTPSKPAVAPKRSSSATSASSSPWMYRGIAVDLAAVRADQALAEAARAKSSDPVVYRGLKVDPTIARELEMQAHEATVRSTATLIYRGLLVPRSCSASKTSMRPGAGKIVGK